MTHRTRLDDKQITRLEELHADPDAWIGYWCSDQRGRSANGGDTDERWHAYPGAVHEIDDGLELAACPALGEGGLHATRHPHRWRGCRVWMVALLGERVGGGIKCAARKREIICEMRPGDLLTPQIAARLGVNLGYLRGVDLRGADLRFTNLQGADLRFTNLQGADLLGSDLRGANLQHADLRDSGLRGSNLQGARLRDVNFQGTDLLGSDLRGANLKHANLRCVNLRDSSLQGADLRWVNLRDSSLRGSDLRGADLRWANLRGSDLRGSNLQGARLRDVHLWGADLRGAKLPNNYEDVAIT